MQQRQFILPLADELVVDLFAGGGGASCGIEQAIRRPVDVAINHDPQAVSLHQANHPQTLHYVSDVFEVDPRAVAGGRRIGLMWASPDCTYHSKARGGKPHRDRNRARRRRGLAWVVCRWAREVRPRVILLENVEEFQHWGPLLEDGTPCPQRRGTTFARWVAQLRNLGYAVEWRELRACDYGAPTIRKRLFLVARCDGQPIVWPERTHGPGRRTWRTAAECIDWALPAPSIFERERPLADATLRRIAAGVRRYVLEAARPYIVRIGHAGHGDAGKVRGVDEPLSTVTSKAEHLLAVPTLVQTGYGERTGQAPRVPGLDKPLGTVVGGQKHALVAAFLAKHYGGHNATDGQALVRPLGTITTQDHHGLVTATLGGAGHAAEVRALLVAYYGSEADGQALTEPLRTVPTRDRFGLVTVHGQDYVISDIGMRMLQPRELYAAQGFPAAYIIDRGADGRVLSKSAQVRMCGNSVCPPVAAAIVAANYVERQEAQRAAA